MNNSHSSRIKPLLTYHISTKTPYIFQNFRKRRPKKIRTVRFFEQGNEYSTHQMKFIQRSLLKVLDIARPTRKVDFSQCFMSHDYFVKCKLYSVLKRISRAKVIYLSRFFKGGSGKNTIEKSFRYFKEMKHLQYRISFSFQDRSNPFAKHQSCQYPLHSLRCCPKLQKVLLENPIGHYCFQRISSRWTRKKYLAMKTIFFDRALLNSITTSLNELTSVSFEYFYRLPQYPQMNYLTFIQLLQNLQEIEIKFQDAPGYDLKKLLQKITDNDKLKKLKLDLNLDCSLKLGQVLEGLTHSKITHFSLKAFVIEHGPLTSLSASFRYLGQLESLKLDLKHHNQAFNPHNELCQLCEQIGSLFFLRHLKFIFSFLPRISPRSNFLHHLYPLFMKQIKLETLCLTCYQIDHSDTFPDFITILRGLQTSLRKLKLDIVIPSCYQNSRKMMVGLIRNLSNIKVLKLPFIVMNSNQSLYQMVEALLGLEYLEKFFIGGVHSEGEASVYFDPISALLNERGLRLRRFHCGIEKENNTETSSSKERNYFLENIFREDPSLEYSFLAYSHGL